MDVTLNSVSRFDGTLRVPSDKSITHRAILLAALAKGRSVIRQPLIAEDCLSTLRCVAALGLRVEKKRDEWIVEGKGLWGIKAPTQPLDCGNSGTTIRLLSGILAAQDFKAKLFGDASLSKRPMDRVANPLREMGAEFKLTDGKFAPFEIQGQRKLRPLHWKNPVASAQVKSAVLLAALHTEGETIFEEPSLSRNHTEIMLKTLGADLRVEGSCVRLRGPFEPGERLNWTVPADFSSAAFFLVGALLIKGARLTAQSIIWNPTRTGLLRVMEEMGVSVNMKEEDLGPELGGSLTIWGGQKLKAVSVGAEIAPRLIDEIPILSVLATQATGKTIISGVEELRVKESDRLSAMAKNLNAMGARVTEKPDGLIIEGPTPLKGAVVDSFDDHRIAMSMAIASLIATGPTTIRNAECVSISFPSFWEKLKELTR